MAVAVMRTAARSRRVTGIRETSSTVSRKLRDGHAAIVWLIGFGFAWRMFAATEAATPTVRTTRTAQRKRLSCLRLCTVVSLHLARGLRAGVDSVGAA